MRQRVRTFKETRDALRANAGAVKRLNQIQQQIGGLSKDAAPYQLGSLKREELIATNSMILHELYLDWAAVGRQAARSQMPSQMILVASIGGAPSFRRWARQSAAAPDGSS